MAPATLGPHLDSEPLAFLRRCSDGVLPWGPREGGVDFACRKDMQHQGPEGDCGVSPRALGALCTRVPQGGGPVSTSRGVLQKSQCMTPKTGSSETSGAYPEASWILLLGEAQGPARRTSGSLVGGPRGQQQPQWPVL